MELIGDLGSGTLDVNNPFPPGRVRLWPAAGALCGHLLDAHVMRWHLDVTGADGHLEGRHLWDDHWAPILAIAFESPRYVFGRFRHALRLIDISGNVSADTEFVHTINDSPAVPLRMRRIGWDAVDSRVLFDFEPVRFRALAGG